MSATLENTYAPLPQTKRGAPIFLSYHAKTGNVVYACGNAIVIRNVENPLVSDMYLEHSCQTTTAKYSPSGFYIASGDIQGNLRIWDTTQKEHPLKIELHPISGAISDIAWSGDSQRVLVVGDGREKFGSVFAWDAGSTVGEISGHTKTLVSGDFRSARPFRIATCGEDFQTNWFEGPPFKFKKSMRDHTRMATCVRFSPAGDLVATCATDKKIVVYDGKTGEKLREWDGHKAGIYGLSWSPDGKSFVTCSADKTAAVWDAATGAELARYSFGLPKPQTSHQQLSCVWAGEAILTVNLEGEISYFNSKDLSVVEPTRLITGHNKSLTALCVDSSTIYSGSYDGKVVSWDAATGANNNFVGQGHKNLVAGIAVQGDKLVTCSMDDTVRFTPIGTREYTASGVDVKSPVSGIAVCKKSDAVIAAAVKSVAVIRDNKVAFEIPVAFSASCISINPAEDEVAVGGKDDKSIHIYSFDGQKLAEKTVISAGIRGALSAVAYSPDGKFLASADSSRNIFVWDAATKELKIEGWVFHTAAVNSIAWSPDSLHVASGGIDAAIYVWSVEKPDKRIAVRNAHQGTVNVVAWSDNNTLLSAGRDCAIKSWKIAY